MPSLDYTAMSLEFFADFKNPVDRVFHTEPFGFGADQIRNRVDKGLFVRFDDAGQFAFQLIERSLSRYHPGSPHKMSGFDGGLIDGGLLRFG